MNPADRYFALIQATLHEALRHPITPTRPAAVGEIPIAAVLPAAAKRLGIACSFDAGLISAALASRPGVNVRFVDGHGHARPIYGALAKRWLIDASSASAQRSAERTPAERLLDRDTPDEAFETLIRQQDADGTFLARFGADAPEPRWYDELVLLHALACRASETERPSLNEAVRRAVLFHTAQTQPDHASSQPWAIAAFLAEPEAIALADMMLHAAGVQQPSTMDSVSLLLLADALDCGRRRTTR